MPPRSHYPTIMHPLEIFHKYGGAEAEEDGQIGWLLGSSCEM